MKKKKTRKRQENCNIDKNGCRNRITHLKKNEFLKFRKSQKNNKNHKWTENIKKFKDFT